MRYQPEDGKWIVAGTATGMIQIKKSLDPEVYEQTKLALKQFLCAYFSSGNCDNKQGVSISPLGATPKGGKRLKVRWGLPGHGKSGSLRLSIAVYCTERRVVIAQVFERRDNPSDTEFEESTESM